MKKLTAILLILILFFNWYGYRIITAIMESKADQQLEAKLDNNQYDESQLVEIRVAINMPYQASQMEFERHYGEMKIDGKYYTYVKRKIENGFLVLKCIPNDSKEMIKAVDNDLFKNAVGLKQDQPAKKQNNNLPSAKNFWSEYDDRNEKFDINPLASPGSQVFMIHSSFLCNVYRLAPERPPQVTVTYSA